MSSYIAPRAKTIQLQLDGRQLSFVVTRQGEALQIASDDQEQRVWIRQQDGPSLVFEIEQSDGSRRRLRVVGLENGEERQVWVEGRLFHYERARPQQHRAASADGSLAASIPAVVSQILVSPGDVVSAGDKLILLESMKMVIPIQAPYDGCVTQINCAAGDSVPAGIPLLELEAASPA